MKIFGYEMGNKNPKEEYGFNGMYPVLNKHGITDPILIFLNEENNELTGARIIISSGNISKHHKNVEIINKKLIKNKIIDDLSRCDFKIGERGVERNIYMENKDYKISMHYFEDNIPSKITGYTFNLILMISKKEK